MVYAEGLLKTFESGDDLVGIADEEAIVRERIEPIHRSLIGGTDERMFPNAAAVFVAIIDEQMFFCKLHACSVVSAMTTSHVNGVGYRRRVLSQRGEIIAVLFLRVQ